MRCPEKGWQPRGGPGLGPWPQGDSGQQGFLSSVLSSEGIRSSRGCPPSRVLPEVRGDVSGHPSAGGALEVLGPTSICCPPPGGGPRLCRSSRPARQGMEPGRAVPAEMKLRKPSQRAGIPAPFLAHSVGRRLGPRPPAHPLGGRAPSSPP